jgi:hypothetical protein
MPAGSASDWSWTWRIDRGIASETRARLVLPVRRCRWRQAVGQSLSTCNHYRTAIRAFAKWCYDTHRTREDALRGVRGYNAKEDRRHDRRTISLDELQRLIAVAEGGPAVGTDGRIGHRQPSDSTRPAARDAGISSPEGQPISKRFDHYLATGGDGLSRNLSHPDVTTESDVQQPMNVSPSKKGGPDASSRLESGSVGNTGVGTRTPDLRIMRPPL